MAKVSQDSGIDEVGGRERHEHYIACVAHRVQMLREEIEQEYLQGGRSTSRGALAELLLRLLFRLHDELRRLHSELELQPSSDSLARLQTLGSITTRTLPQLRQAMALTEQTSQAAIVVEEFADQADLVRSGTQAIIHPSPEYNASFVELMGYLRGLVSSFEQAGGHAVFSGAPPRFVTMTYPQAESDMVLRQAHLAHELGHFIDSELGFSGELQRGEVFLEQELGWVRDAIRTESHTGEETARTKDLRVLPGRYAARWLREIVADFLGVCILGPAFVLAFDEVTLALSGAAYVKLKESHPPEQLRKELMAKFVVEEFLEQVVRDDRFVGLDKTQKTTLENVRKWIEELSTTDQLRATALEGHRDVSRPVAQAVYLALEGAMRRAFRQLRQVHCDRIRRAPWFCSTDDLLDALALQPLISVGLVPTVLLSNRSRDPSFSAVMNSGWFHLISSWRDYQYFSRNAPDPSRGDVMKAWLSLQSLIAKAIEDLRFKKEYQRSKGGPNG